MFLDEIGSESNTCDNQAQEEKISEASNSEVAIDETENLQPDPDLAITKNFSEEHVINTAVED